ncbi:MAG TPA: VOC family protein [Candidatus Dormibacteraeota bacterium]|nr:VOC family protein [Candidatus Dormibacteraeota bacterium]
MGVPVAYFEIVSPDVDRARRFYSELFDWKLVDIGDPTYSMVDTGAGDAAIGGGIGQPQRPTDPGGTKIYMRVDDLQAYLERAERLGGRTVVPPTPLPGDFGSFAVLADPDGQLVGLWA